MAISLTCVCGAILEIDDKFQGQKIPCPDCNRLLDTAPPISPPRATSGWALASLIFSVGGMLTLVGPLVGIACGLIGLRQVSRDPRYGGANFARAGIICGGLFALMSMWALVGAEFLGLDGFFRLYVGAKNLKFDTAAIVRGHPLPGEFCVTLKRPGHGWGLRSVDNTDAAEDITLVNLWEDAHIIVFGMRPEDQDKADDCRRDAINAFLKSNLVKSLLPKNAEPPAYPLPAQIKLIKEDENNPKQQDFTVEFSLGAIPRIFLFHLSPQRGRMNVAVGGARASRFDRLEEPIRQSLESCQLEDVK